MQSRISWVVLDEEQPSRWGCRRRRDETAQRANDRTHGCSPSAMARETRIRQRKAPFLSDHWTTMVGALPYRRRSMFRSAIESCEGPSGPRDTGLWSHIRHGWAEAQVRPGTGGRLAEADSCKCGRPRAEFLVGHLGQWRGCGVAELVQIRRLLVDVEDTGHDLSPAAS